MAGVEVYWATRDLAGLALWGNHHFLLIYLPSGYYMQRTKRYKINGQRFCTLAAFAEGGELVFRANDSYDYQAVKEKLMPAWAAGLAFDYDLEEHLVQPPSGTGYAFALEIERRAYNFRRNTEGGGVSYSLVDENCAAWVNTILKVCGVSQSERLRLGEFSGLDWGEEDAIPESLFDD